MKRGYSSSAVRKWLGRECAAAAGSQALDFVAVLHPAENATAIKICDQQNDRGNHGENDRRIVLLISNAGALHGEKVSPGDSSNDRHKQKSGQLHSAEAKHIAKIVLGKTRKQK